MLPKQRRGSHHDCQSPRSGNRDVESLAVENEADSTRCIVGTRCGSREEDDVRFAALKLVDRPYFDVAESALCENSTDASYLRVVWCDDDDVAQA